MEANQEYRSQQYICSLHVKRRALKSVLNVPGSQRWNQLFTKNRTFHCYHIVFILKMINLPVVWREKDLILAAEILLQERKLSWNDNMLWLTVIQVFVFFFRDLGATILQRGVKYPAWVMIYLLHWLCGQDKCQQPCSFLTDVSAVLRVSVFVILAGLIIESSINRGSSISFGLILMQVMGLSLRFLSTGLVNRQWNTHVLCAVRTLHSLQRTGCGWSWRLRSGWD